MFERNTGRPVYRKATTRMITDMGKGYKQDRAEVLAQSFEGH